MISFFVVVVMILTMIPYHPLEVRAAVTSKLDLGTPVRLSEKVYQLSNIKFDNSGVVNGGGGYFTVSVNNGVTAIGSLPSGITELTNGIKISGLVTDKSTETNRVFNFSSGITYEDIQTVIQDMVFTRDSEVTQLVTVKVVPGTQLSDGKTSVRTYNERHFVYVERLTTMTFKDAIDIATSNNGHLVEPKSDNPTEMLGIAKLFNEFKQPFTARPGWNFISFIGATKTTAPNWDSPRDSNNTTKFVSSGVLTGLGAGNKYMENGSYSHLTLLLDNNDTDIKYLGVDNSHGGSSGYLDPGVIVEYNSGTIDIITATKDLTLVDKTALNNKVTDIANENLKQADYTLESWTALQTALTEAGTVLTNPTATQVQVDEALAALTEARGSLVPTTPVVDKTKLQQKVNEEGTLIEENYTTAS